ncbi:MAG TPA: hypothetical protein VGD94_03185 [Vicinamibacterales bacterium]
MIFFMFVVFLVFIVPAAVGFVTAASVKRTGCRLDAELVGATAARPVTLPTAVGHEGHEERETFGWDRVKSTIGLRLGEVQHCPDREQKAKR